MWYDVQHGVHVDWFVPLSEPEFAEQEEHFGQQFFDWNPSRVLRYQPSMSEDTVVKRTVLFFNGSGFVQCRLSKSQQ